MSRIKDSKEKLVRRLYYDRLYSAREIADRLDSTKDKVYHFMKRRGIKRRNLSEQNKAFFERKPLSFKLKKNLNNFESKLKIIGVVLYWGEGAKIEKNCTIDFANSDLCMIKLFLRFLREVCGVKESRLRVLLYCYANQNVKELIHFWSIATGIPQKQFSKPYVRKDFRKDKVGRMPYGLVHVRYADKKLLILINRWIAEYKENFWVGGRAVNYTSL
ncbi:MAG: hypothetical protein ABH833_01050 [Parcubacteria group bacterium]